MLDYIPAQIWKETLNLVFLCEERRKDGGVSSSEFIALLSVPNSLHALILELHQSTQVLDIFYPSFYFKPFSDGPVFLNKRETQWHFSSVT
jgi:hypothetical protein